EIFEKSFSNIENEFTSEEGKMKKKQEAKEAGESIEVDKPLEPLKN
ncbi:transcriptional regulator Hpr, partial [Bacillus licheniformis]|nr:transcriptional regulator Hpr [Bacillus licheniformis]